MLSLFVGPTVAEAWSLQAGVPVVAESKPSLTFVNPISIVALALIGLIAGCSEPVSFKENPIGSLPPGSFELAWLMPLTLKTGDVVDRMEVRDEVIYVFTHDKQVIAINRKQGTLRYVVQVQTPSPRVLPPVELADKIVFPTATSLELFDKQGNHLRSVPLAAPLHSGASGEGDTVYFGAFDPYGGRLLAVNLQNEYNTSRWQLLTKGSISAAPLVYQSFVYVGTEAGEVYAVNEDRNALWSIEGGVFQTAGPIVADLKADDAALYVASKDSKLYSINRTTGKLLWQYFAGVPLKTSPVPTLDTVYQTIPGQGVAAIDKYIGVKNPPYNRTPKWIVPNATQFLAQDDTDAYLLEPRVDDKDPSITRNVIVAVDKQTGKEKFESQHTDWTVFGTNTKDATIYAGYPNGQIIALRPDLKAGRIGELVLKPVPMDAVAMSK
jgi:outer membrane protein assembly factor BamB